MDLEIPDMLKIILEGPESKVKHILPKTNIFKTKQTKQSL